MKIHRLKAVNLKRIAEVDLVPGDASLVIIGGNNGAGKTSVLDSIWMALGGAEAVPQRPIRDGEDSAEVSLDLGEYLVTRRWSRNGSGNLSVQNKDGDTKAKPQVFLDGLVGPLSFDPLAFSRQSPKEQGETLRRLVGLDLTALEAERDRVFQERTIVNRSVKSLEARLAAAPKVDAPDEPVSMAELSQLLTKAVAQNESRARLGRELLAARKVATDREEALAKLRAAVIEAEESLAAARRARDEALTALDKAPETVDLSSIQTQIAEAEQVNIRVRAKKERASRLAELEAAKAESEEHTKRLAQIDQEKQETLAKAPFPVPGLSIEDGLVTYQGFPFDQCSSAEQLRVSLAMGIAMNPTLKVLLIRDGSLLDKGSLQVVDEMVTAAGVQCWLERVSDEGPVTYVIEEGKVRTKEDA